MRSAGRRRRRCGRECRSCGTTSSWDRRSRSHTTDCGSIWPSTRSKQRPKPRMDEAALDLLQKFLVLDPSGRVTAKDALNHPYFNTEPLPCRPEELPHVPEDTHEYQVKLKKNNKEVQHEIHPHEASKNVSESKTAFQGKRLVPQQSYAGSKMLEIQPKVAKYEINCSKL
eukprot:TRINITY_DN17041_c0_g1_i1.p1 TRINITY_DN17041_c0_g1~~TRINITY_DN17041_c0_g1_i1.p1  ORF type:complete len:170 (+),score=5.64 TRINITY_DN17041_c0_g1_i1:106-615(+)